MTELEFWPEYNGGPLWSIDGQSIALESLPLPPLLRDQLIEWNSRYDDSLLPFEDNDVPWLAEGQALLTETRIALAGEFRVTVTEPWWDELSDQE